MTSKYAPPVKIPDGFSQILKDFTRELLREQPQEVNEFAVNYFSEKLAKNSQFKVKEELPPKSPPEKNKELPPYQRPQSGPPKPPQEAVTQPTLPEHVPKPASAPPQPPQGLPDEPEDPILQQDSSSAAAFSKSGIRRDHKSNEDAYCLIQPDSAVPPGSTFVTVCDGHGGATASSFAARHLYKNITSSPEYPKHIQNAIMAGFAKTEDDLATHVKNLPDSEDSSCGTCVVAAFVLDNTLYVANLGDSRAVLGQKDEGAIALTKDHKAQSPEEMKRLQDCGAYIQNQRLFGVLAVSRSIGDFEMKKAGRESRNEATEGGALIAIPEVFEHHIDGNDRFIVLASDGVWDVVSNETAVEVVTASLNASGNDCKQAAKELVAHATQQGSEDDITVIVALLNNNTPVL